MEKHVAQCQCGQLKLTAEGPPIRVSVCHCLCCQQRTGSVYGVTARFDTSRVTTEGRSSRYSRTGDEGSRATFRFCPDCGTSVFWQADAQPEVTLVAVGCFADPTFPPPRMEVYLNRQHPWTKHMVDEPMDRSWG